MEGNLINIVSDQGPGPKEYTDLKYATIGNDELILSDGKKAKRIYYTLEGKYIRHEKSLFSIGFALLGDKFILHLGYPQSFDFNTTPNLVVSIKDSALRRALPYQNIQKYAVSGSLKYNYRGDLLFHPTLSDTIYHILSDSTFTAKYFVKHKKSIWQLYKENLGNGEIIQKIKNEGYSNFSHYFNETEKSIHFTLAYKKVAEIQIYNYWYDKENKKVYAIFNSPLTRYPYIVTNLCNQTIGVWGNYYIAEIRPETIETYREYQERTKDSLNFTNEELRKIIETKDDPNHALALYKVDFNKHIK
jgi:hypothetical protein